MASGPGRVEEQPPALPVKQHRSHSSRCSSVESNPALFSPVGLRHENYECDDVFPEATDCHAAQCPLHRRYDPCRHQARFFSDETPPPVPKKRLVRTLSLPGTNVDQLSHLPPLQIRPQNFDNPLYMLAPVPDTLFHDPAPLVSFSQLTFDTPDEHLLNLFSTFEDQRVVSQGIQHRHLLFLRSTAHSVEAGILLQATERDVSSYQLQDFLLCEDGEPKQIGDRVYYSLHSPKLPGRMLALRVHKQTEEAPSDKHQSSHVNVQDVIADCPAAKPPGGGCAEYAAAHTNVDLTSVQCFLQRGVPVSVERDLPSATLEDFVQESGSLQSTVCVEYDRRVCALLLQILTGLQHLCNISTAAAELRPRGIFLVWPNREDEEGESKRDHKASEAKRAFKTSRWREAKEWGVMGGKGKTQTLWRTHGSPRVVLTPLPPAPSAAHPFTYITSQIRALIQYCLNSPVPTRSESSYRRGLLYLASLLQSESSCRPKVADMVALLQVLLWGPRVPLFSHSFPMTAAAAHNWLTVKRALLVMKLAERGLIQDQSALDWEDCMCLRYLSFTDSKTVVSTSSQLWLTRNMDGPP